MHPGKVRWGYDVRTRRAKMGVHYTQANSVKADWSRPVHVTRRIPRSERAGRQRAIGQLLGYSRGLLKKFELQV